MFSMCFPNYTLFHFISYYPQIENTCTSETTPLHANSYRQLMSAPSSRFASSNSVNSSLTSTTYESSLAIINDSSLSSDALSRNADVSKPHSLEEVVVVPSKMPSFHVKIKITLTLFILLVGLVLCFLSLLHCATSPFSTSERSKNNISAHNKLFDPGTKEPKTNEEFFDELGRYIIEDYDALPPFSDFLPVSMHDMYAYTKNVVISAHIRSHHLLTGGRRDLWQTPLVLLRQ